MCYEVECIAYRVCAAQYLASLKGGTGKLNDVEQSGVRCVIEKYKCDNRAFINEFSQHYGGYNIVIFPQAQQK